MEIIHLSSWEEFERTLHELAAQREARAKETSTDVSYPLYRGHENHEWKLETTLERQSDSVQSVSEYYRYAYVSSHQIGAFTKHRWKIPTPQQYNELTKDFDGSSFSSRPAYDYLAYLRHHGFPSPLLDWTRSPYIAAFFAFRRQLTKVERVAIFVYCENWGVGKGWTGSAPTVHSWGPYVRTHRRHFLQQCVYTTCVVRNEGAAFYANHEEGFRTPSWAEQDKLWKLTLPLSERRKAVECLDAMNINAFSLFQSNDTLVETMATREFILRRPHALVPQWQTNESPEGRSGVEQPNKA